MNSCTNYGAAASLIFFCIPLFAIGRVINFHRTKKNLLLSVGVSIILNLFGLFMICSDAGFGYAVFMTIVNVFTALGTAFFNAVITNKFDLEDSMK